MNYSKICLLLITICLIIITFTLGLSKSGIEWLREGYDLYKKAKYEEAIASYKEALKEQSDSFEIHLSIGKCYSKLGDCEEAIKYYNKAIDLNGENLFTVYYNKGKAYLALRDYREAIDCFNEALKIKPGNIEAKNRKEEAEKILEKEQYSNILISSNREQNKKAIEYFNKGLKYFNNKDYGMAILWFDEALNLYPLLEEAQNKKKEAENFLSLYKNSACEKWNLAEDFDTSNNLTGPWFFGYKEDITGTFKVFPFKSINNDNIFVWANARDTQPPSIWRNTLSRQSHSIHPGMVSFHPGPYNEFVTIRWVSPCSGQFNIK
ncbi:MAG: tetratricopeptide repeat protein, partial [Candidatus Eremiobacterota bacterium]